MKNSNKRKTAVVDETTLWENRDLGAEEEYVRVSKQGTGERIDKGLGLQMISMRLPKDAVQKLKDLSRKEGLGYQPFVRQIVMNFLQKKA